MDDVVAAWTAAFMPVQAQVESIGCITRGRGLRQSLNSGNGGSPTEGRRPTGAPPPRRAVSSSLIPASNGPQPRTLRIPSTSALQARPRTADESPQPSPSYKRPDYLAPTDFTTATALGGTQIDRTMSRSPTHSTPTHHSNSPYSRQNNLNSNSDYFGRPSTSSTDVSLRGSNGNLVINKKRPPPPPPKRLQNNAPPPQEWVVAQYPFQGQGQGDLSFGEGDRIRIVKKTGTDQDWWVGELHGVQGSFPANYCKPT